MLFSFLSPRTAHLTICLHILSFCWQFFQWFIHFLHKTGIVLMFCHLKCYGAIDLLCRAKWAISLHARLLWPARCIPELVHYGDSSLGFKSHVKIWHVFAFKTKNSFTGRKKSFLDWFHPTSANSIAQKNIPAKCSAQNRNLNSCFIKFLAIFVTLFY